MVEILNAIGDWSVGTQITAFVSVLVFILGGIGGLIKLMHVWRDIRVNRHTTVTEIVGTDYTDYERIERMITHNRLADYTKVQGALIDVKLELNDLVHVKMNSLENLIVTATGSMFEDVKKLLDLKIAEHEEKAAGFRCRPAVVERMIRLAVGEVMAKFQEDILVRVNDQTHRLHDISTELHALNKRVSSDKGDPYGFGPAVQLGHPVISGPSFSYIAVESEFEKYAKEKIADVYTAVQRVFTHVTEDRKQLDRVYNMLREEHKLVHEGITRIADLCYKAINHDGIEHVTALVQQMRESLKCGFESVEARFDALDDAIDDVGPVIDDRVYEMAGMDALHSIDEFVESLDQAGINFRRDNVARFDTEVERVVEGEKPPVEELAKEFVDKIAQRESKLTYNTDGLRDVNGVTINKVEPTEELIQIKAQPVKMPVFDVSTIAEVLGEIRKAPSISQQMCEQIRQTKPGAVEKPIASTQDAAATLPTNALDVEFHRERLKLLFDVPVNVAGGEFFDSFVARAVQFLQKFYDANAINSFNSLVDSVEELNVEASRAIRSHFIDLACEKLRNAFKEEQKTDQVVRTKHLFEQLVKADQWEYDIIRSKMSSSLPITVAWDVERMLADRMEMHSAKTKYAGSMAERYEYLKMLGTNEATRIRAALRKDGLLPDPTDPAHVDTIVQSLLARANSAEDTKAQIEHLEEVDPEMFERVSGRMIQNVSGSA